MMTGATAGRTAILLAVAVLAGGCTAPFHSALPPPASRAGAGSALAEAGQRVHCRQRGRQASIPLPAGFAASAAVLCDAVVRELHGRGHAVYVERVADRGLAPLAAALRRPSQRPAPGVACAVQVVFVPLLLLIGRDGRIVRPVIPRDECGRPQQQVLDAIEHVPWVSAHLPG